MQYTVMPHHPCNIPAGYGANQMHYTQSSSSVASLTPALPFSSSYFASYFIFTFFFFFRTAAPEHMKVPRLGVESELQQLA